MKRAEDAKHKAEAARQEAIPFINSLCENLAGLDGLRRSERFQGRVEAESGVVNLHQREQFAKARIYYTDQISELRKEIARTGIRFDRKRDCAREE